MHYIPQLMTLFVIVLLACISPGPDFIAVASSALSNRSRGLGVAAGTAMACTIWASLAMFGLGLILTRLAWLYDFIRLAGAGYLIYLGVKMLLSARHAYGSLQVNATRQSPRSALRTGLTVGLTNPKSAAFFGSLFITILPVGIPHIVQGEAIIIVALVAWSWFSLLAFMFSSARVRRIYTALRRPIDALMGAFLLGLGIRLAVAR